MKNEKTNKFGRRILSFLLTIVLVIGLMPENVMTVKAEEIPSKPLSVTAFATPEQLMSSDNFALHTDTGRGTAQKVYFGTNGSNKQTWYIAGSDATDSIVLLCNPSLPMATGTMFEDDKENNKTYSADWRCTYETTPNEVYPNHYGASDLRGVLQEYTSNDNTEKFSAAEKELMQSTKVYTDDDKRKDESETDYTYYTEDVLYPAYGDYDDDKFITVGANSAESLNGRLKVSLKSAPYNSGGFWLRAPYYDFSSDALITNQNCVGHRKVNLGYSVVPAFRLNLSSVLFASAATAATSGASLTYTMTFRVDGDDKITSQASYSTDNVIVDAAEEETVYLYVQGKDGTTDWVYSQEVSADTTIATGTIKSGAKDSNGSAVSLTSVDLSQCEVWIEKKVTDDNLVYAVMAKEIETIATVAVTDITAPVAGAELDVAATCNTTGVSTTTPTVSYTKNGESVFGNAAGYLAGYIATVELEAAGDYTFTDETTATINGEAASVSYDADTGKLTVSYTFKTAKLPLGNAYYVTKDELMSSFDLDGTDDTVGKVYFGTNGSNKQTWYIAGSDAADSIVLLCDPSLPMATGTMFENDWQNNKTYSADWRCTYGTSPSEVYPNHYGASDLREVLQEYTSNNNTEKFSAAEKELMQSTKVYTDDDKRKDESKTDYTYYTEDVLYPAYGNYKDDQYITVGANSAESLNGGLKVSLKSAPYNGGDSFWLRAPRFSDGERALVANPGFFVSSCIVVNSDCSVVPAFRLNLSSVLFASAATAATSDASLTDTMTFRVDDTEKIKSKAAYTTCGVTVDYDEGDGNVFLYVQDADSVYSVEITEDTTLALSDMTGIESLTAENTKIWLEKSEDNVAYALMSEAVLTEHIPNEDDGDCTTSITCSVCGTVTTEAKAEHTPNADDGNCTTPVTCSVCGKVTTEAKPHIDESSDEYCDNCGVIYNGIGAHLAGYSVSLNGSIGVNFHMDLTQDVLDDNEAYMLFTLPNGTTQKVMVSDAKAKESAVIEGKTYYIFTCNVAAKEMTDTIQAQLITSDGSKTQVYEYSVREYADRILSGIYDDETKELVKAMLHYGAYSQEWFDYNTTNLANNELDTLDLSEADDWDEFNPSISNNDKVGSFTSAYLTLESDTAINLKFKLADGVSFEDLRVVVEDPLGNVVPVTIDTTENVCLITLTGIKASDLDTTYSFGVTDGQGNESYILYSAMSYACAVANSEMDQELKDVTAALRIFNLRANEKFEY